MRRTNWGWFRVVLAAVGTFLADTTAGAAGPDAPPRAAESSRPGAPAAALDGPVNIFLNAPADLGSLWKSLTDPDFVILRGADYARLTKGLRPPAVAAPTAAGATVVAVAVGGAVSGDVADLTVRLDVALAADDPVWVPIRLDGQTLTAVTAGGRDLPTRAADAGGWQVELKGAGRHSVAVRLPVPVRVTPEGKRLEIAVPEAPSTRLSVVVPGGVSEATTGPGEPVTRAMVEGQGTDEKSGPTRLSAELTPRARIAVVWRDQEPDGERTAPLLVAHGEIAIDVDPGSFRTRSTWSIRAVRGVARELVFGLDPGDDVVELMLDNQPPPAGIERVGGATRMTVRLPEPLGPNQERTLVLTTRRAIPSGSATRVPFSGFPLADAREQTGAIGVVTSDNLWVTATPGRGVRQIDPRTELPPELRARPATGQGFRFSEQPFELALRVESSPPLVRVAARTTVALEAGSARLDTEFDFETARGRLFDLSLGLPPGLVVESVGPADVVGGWQTGVLPEPFAPGLGIGGLRLLTLRLGPKSQAGRRFTFRLVGRQALDPSARDASIALVQPIGATSGGGRVAVLTEPGMTADLASGGGRDAVAARFRPSPLAPPPDWPWPSGVAPTSTPVLWLRYDESPPELPLRIATLPRELSETTSLAVRVDRREVEVTQVTECAVRFGSVRHLEVNVPPALVGRWAVDGVERTTALGRTRDGGESSQLELAAASTGPLRLRFRSRLPLGSLSGPGASTQLALPCVRVAGATSNAPVRATIEAAPGLVVAPTGDSWSAGPEPAPAEAEAGTPVRLTGPRPGAGDQPLELRVAARAAAVLPRLVISRLLLRTVQGAEGDLRTTAAYRVEAHESALPVAPPRGAELQTVRVGGATVSEVETLPGTGGVRIAIPPSVGRGPVLVELDYTTPPARARGPWSAPRLIGAGVVQQTLWEVRLPASRALVGVPEGWSDENEWYWDVYVWKRRPWTSPAGLSAWVGGHAAGAAGDAEARRDGHAYLFGRPGPATDLPLTVASRALLVASCSGVVLAVGGLLILVWRPSARLAAVAVPLLGLAVAALVHPTVTLLAVQSGMVGVVLTALVALMQRLVGRRRYGPGIFGEPNQRNAGAAPGSALSRGVGVGSDDSTAIRVRTASTLDYVVTASDPAGGEAATAPGSSRSEPAARGGAGP